MGCKHAGWSCVREEVAEELGEESLEETLVLATALTALGTVALAVATIYLAYKTGKMVEANRDTVEANREMVAEMRASRVAQERPQIVVDADYSRSPLIDVVVRNIGKGAAREITFDFSALMVSSLSADEHSVGVPLNELSYFKEGMDFLAPGAEITTAWDSIISLRPVLEEEGLEDGITITSRYKSLDGDPYETEWTINPLLMERYDFPEQGVVDVVKELVKEVEGLSKTFDRAMDSSQGELRVSTDAERRERREDVTAGGKYGHMDKVRVKRGEDMVLNGQIGKYLGGGLYQVFVSGQGPQRIGEEDISPMPCENAGQGV